MEFNGVDSGHDGVICSRRHERDFETAIGASQFGSNRISLLLGPSS